MSLLLKIFILSVSYALRALPCSFRRAMASSIGSILRWVGFRKNVIVENLKTAFPELTPPQRTQLLKQNYRHYGQVTLDFLLTASWKRRDYLKRVHVEGMEHLQRAMNGGRGCYLLSCHVGSWELAIGATASYGVPLDVIVKRAQAGVFEDFLQWYRRRTGSGIFLESHSHYQILKSLKQGRCVGFILDQFMGPPIGLPVSFFGQQAGTAAALSFLIERHEAPVILVHAYNDANGRTCTQFSPPLDFGDLSQERVSRMYQRTQVFNDAIEGVVRQFPDQWIWVHRRWKDFKGQPRWKLASATAVFVGMLFLGGCAQVGSEITGIELPPDPEVTAPVFQEDHQASNEPEPQSIAHAQEMGIVKGGKKKPKKRKPTKKIAQVVEKDRQPTFVALPAERIPFKVGERMEIDLRWTALPAGRAILEVKSLQEVQGRQTFHLWGNVLSSRLVDTIYHVDNTIESYVDHRGLIPYKFLLHMVESKQKKETRVVFDHQNQKAHYWSKRISERWGDENIDRPDEFHSGSQDMFSALYYVRTLNYELNKLVKFPVYEKGKNMMAEVLPVANEVLTTPAGVFQAWKLSLKVLLNNQFKQTGDMFIWISDDSNRYIVKFDAKIKIGSLKGELVSVREQ